MNRLYILVGLLCTAFHAAAQTPVQVSNYNPTGNGRPGGLLVYNNKLYFNADSAGERDRLCAYDMTTGIQRIRLFPALTTEQWGARIIFNGKLHIAINGTTSTRMVRSIYVYDGINPVIPAPNVGLDTFLTMGRLCTAGGKLYFGATKTAPKSELFCYTGSGSATMINFAPALSSGARPEYLTECGGKLYFNALTSGTGYKLHVLDPATNNVSLLTTSAYPNGFQSPYLYSDNGTLYFIARTDTPGNQVYMYDGTAVRRISNFRQSDRGAFPPMCKYGESLYFSGATTDDKYQLYRCGTAAPSLTRAAVIDSTINSQISGMIVYKNKLYFSANKTSIGREYWRFDRSGLSLVADLCPGGGNGAGALSGGTDLNTGLFAIYQDRLYFKGDKCSGDGEELFRLYDTTGVSTGVERMGWDGSVQVYPNPVITTATMSLTLQRAEVLGAALTDMQGRQVWASTPQSYPAGRSEINIPMPGLASGQYTLRITDGAGQLQATRQLVR